MEVGTIVVRYVTRIGANLRRTIDPNLGLGFFRQFDNQALTSRVRRATEATFAMGRKGQTARGFDAFRRVQISSHVIVRITLRLRTVRVIVLTLTIYHGSTSSRMVVDVEYTANSRDGTENVTGHFFRQLELVRHRLFDNSSEGELECFLGQHVNFDTND